MENQKTKTIYDSVDPNAIVNIDVPGYLFMRVNQLIFSGLGFTKVEDIIDAVNRIRENNIDKENSKEYHLETLLILNSIISEQAKKQKKTTPFDFSINPQEPQ